MEEGTGTDMLRDAPEVTQQSRDRPKLGTGCTSCVLCDRVTHHWGCLGMLKFPANQAGNDLIKHVVATGQDSVVAKSEASDDWLARDG